MSIVGSPAKSMKLAVLTSGGDSAGMNAAVRAVVKAGILKGCETWVVREGYEGLVRGNSEYASAVPGRESLQDVQSMPESVPNRSVVDNLRFGDGPLFKSGEGDGLDERTGKSLRGRYIVRVGWDDVRGWMGQGGTVIGTARSNSFRTPEGRLAAAHNMIKEGIDALVVCGGDGSLTGANLFRSEWPSLVQKLLADGSITAEKAQLHSHLKIAGLVGSIDNDMSMTDLTIGAPTALHRICEALDNIDSTAASHSRAFVVEVMGRHCGWLALMAVAERISSFIPERPPEDPWKTICVNRSNRLEHLHRQDVFRTDSHKHREVGKRKTIVIVAEGAHDSNLKPIKADYVKEILSERLGLDTRVTQLGHTQRGGRPCAFDRILPTLQGLEAVEVLLQSTPETPSYMIGIHENKISRIPLVDAVAMTKAVAAAIEAKDFKKAMSLRDPEFEESLEGFFTTSSLSTERLLPKNQRLRIAIIHMGAPAGGMNGATRAAVRYCLSRGHTPLAIFNGFKGLLDDAVQELSWLKVDSWMPRGGSELGTNRATPDIDLGGVAAKFQQHKFDALFLIGGFEAFCSLLILDDARSHYPSFRIPLIHLPATISNNVPMTEFSLGSDTSLNALVDACDAIKQSASASRNRVFVVETQGGQCGYIATMGALATGAVIVYTPESGINLDTLRTDVHFLLKRYKLDAKGNSEGRLVLKSEQASSIYTADLITKILKEEGGELFDSRSASLGHTLQGGVPSPMDRARAVRLSMKCMTWIEREHAILKTLKVKKPGHESAAVITIQGSDIQFVQVQEMKKNADMKNRRGLKQWWQGFKQLAEDLGGRTALVESLETR